MRIVVFDAEALTYQRLLQGVDGVEVVATPSYPAALEAVADADALMALAPYITDEMVARAGRLRWIQALTTGVDTFDRLPSLKPHVILTSARGIHGPQMAEMAVLMMLSLSRDLPSMLNNQRKRNWERWPQGLLWNKTVAIVGLGVIAEALAVRCRPFGMKVIGVSTEQRDVEGFVRVYGRRDISIAFAESDYVVVLTPYSAETHHLVNRAALAAMRPEAYLINLARGGVVDEAALLQALQADQIAGAAIDVFEQEPLPPEHPLWNAPNVIITPHMGGYSNTYPEQLLPIITRNIKSILAGDVGALENRVWTKYAHI